MDKKWSVQKTEGKQPHFWAPTLGDGDTYMGVWQERGQQVPT